MKEGFFKPHSNKVFHYFGFPASPNGFGDAAGLARSRGERLEVHRGEPVGVGAGRRHHEVEDLERAVRDGDRLDVARGGRAVQEPVDLHAAGDGLHRRRVDDLQLDVVLPLPDAVPVPEEAGVVRVLLLAGGVVLDLAAAARHVVPARRLRGLARRLGRLAARVLGLRRRLGRLAALRRGAVVLDGVDRRLQVVLADGTAAGHEQEREGGREGVLAQGLLEGLEGLHGVVLHPNSYEPGQNA